jgi:ion channel-forming bestrophin family protein
MKTAKTVVVAWDREKRSWFRVVAQIRCSIIPAISLRLLICSLFALFVSLLYEVGIDVSVPVLSAVVPSIVLGLLLVFRTNTAYERFWEGRKLWGQIANAVRNLSRYMWVAIEEQQPEDRTTKIRALRLLIAFAIATKLHLRYEPVNDELKVFVPQEQWEKLTAMNHPPLKIAFWIGDYLQRQYQKQCLDRYQLTSMLELVNTMVDAVGGCERILKTPIPLAYSIHLKQLLLIYSLSLPFQVVKDLHWWTAPIVSVISFTVFGIEELGIEIENPFGYDLNDLPLDRICQTMQTNIEDLITLAPCTRLWDC